MTRMTIPFETSEKPWFGPRKRATQLLMRRTQVLPPPDAVEAFQDILGSAARQIRRVRFIDYIHQYRQPFRYTIALSWIGPHADARDAVYDNAEQIVKATGFQTDPGRLN